MFATVYIRLRQLLRQEQPELVGLVVERQGDLGQQQLQLTLSRLGDQAERIAQTIMSCAPGCDWRASQSHDQPSPHALAHLAIDQASEHLQAAGSAFLLDAPSLAVAGSGLFHKEIGDGQRRPPYFAGSCSAHRVAPGRIGRNQKERGS